MPLINRYILFILALLGVILIIYGLLMILGQKPVVEAGPYALW